MSNYFSSKSALFNKGAKKGILEMKEYMGGTGLVALSPFFLTYLSSKLWEDARKEGSESMAAVAIIMGAFSFTAWPATIVTLPLGALAEIVLAVATPFYLLGRGMQEMRHSPAETTTIAEEASIQESNRFVFI